MVRFLHKISTVAGKVPVVADLVAREFAYNAADGLIYALNAANAVICLNPPPEPVWSVGTLYRSNATARVTGQGTTDSNGRITVNLTKDNTSTGTAVFSRVLSKQATTTLPSGGSVTQAAFVVCESVTAKQIVFRAVMGSSVLIGGNTVTFAGSGYTIDYDVQGLT